MAVATFDTLKFANTLKAAGVPPQQAEAQAVAFAEVVQLNFKELATKEDVAAVRADLERMRADIERVTAELRAEMDRIAKAAKADLEQTAKAAKADLEQAAKSAKADLEQTAKDIRRELDHAVERLERKLAEETQKLHARFDTFQAKHAGDMALVKWMLAAIITIGGGILVRLFFFRGM